LLVCSLCLVCLFVSLLVRLVGNGSTPRSSSKGLILIFDLVLLRLELTEPRYAYACETVVEDVGSRRSFICLGGLDSHLRDPTWGQRWLGSKGPERKVMKLEQETGEGSVEARELVCNEDWRGSG
jgi:hypothetical protein